MEEVARGELGVGMRGEGGGKRSGLDSHLGATSRLTMLRSTNLNFSHKIRWIVFQS